MAGLGVENFAVLEDGDTASLFESERTIVPSPRRFRVYSLLLLDLSGSLVDDENTGIARLIEQVQRYVSTVTDLSRNSEHYIGIAAFDGRAEPQTISDFSVDAASVEDSLSEVDCNELYCLDPSTNLNGAVTSGVATLDGARAAAAGDGVEFFESFLVVFTDGRDQAARVSDSEALASTSMAAHQVLTIGLGGEIDRDHLISLGSAGFEFAENIDALGDVFERIAHRIADRANSYYQFDYCSPKRQGSHELTLRVEWEGILGEARSEFDATGFTYGCLADPEACPAGMADCDNDEQRCEASLLEDAKTCGECSNACDGNEECVEGVCRPPCSVDEVRCLGLCVDLAVSKDHCGACGNSCSGGAACSAGECVCDSDAERCGGECVSLASDLANCGSCGVACDGGQECVSGECQCPQHRPTLCEETCVDLRVSRVHCGECGVSCRSDQKCSAGSCECNDADAAVCAGVCLSCGEDEAPHCGTNGSSKCCPPDYPHFCDVAGWGTGCFNGEGTTDCDTVVRCPAGDSHICHSGYRYNCTSRECDPA